MVRQQLHSEVPESKALACADCILHLTHHTVTKECTDKMFEIAAEYRDQNITHISFLDYYDSLYEEALLRKLLGKEVMWADVSESESCRC